MCGICGLAYVEGRLEEAFSRARVGVMIDALGHRGPDASGLFATDSAAIGATRLAIRAVHDGAQPLVDPETGVVVVCNGEIDNHRELRAWLEQRGRVVPCATDVAVIPGLYLELGDAFVERLVGAFALAVWDPRRARLLLARDRAGERPLFFTRSEDEVAFATEIAALVADTVHPKRIDRSALAGYLRFGSFVAPHTPFVEVRRVAPAERVVLDGSGVTRQRYWRWNVVAAAKRAPSIEDFDAVFRQAVRRQSDVDVGYGVFLSGGLDSSLVAAVAKSVRPEQSFKAFTLRFLEESYDEGQFAERVAEVLRIECVPVWVRPDDLPAELSALVGLVGEPLADPAWIPTALLARRAAQDVKVALVGEGADELFAGYPTYIGARMAQAYTRVPKPLRALVERIVRTLPSSDKKMPVSFLLRRFVEGAGLDGIERHLLWTSTITPTVLARLGVADPEVRADVGTDAELLDLVQRHDLETSLAEGLLTKADRASMRFALELRAPFLDQAVMDFAASLPAKERVRGLRTKVFLKRCARRYLPEAIVRRRKRGLSVPLGSWLRGPLYEWAERKLGSELLAEAGVDHHAAAALLVEHRRRHADHSRPLWALIVLSEWLEWASHPRAVRVSRIKYIPNPVAVGTSYRRPPLPEKDPDVPAA